MTESNLLIPRNLNKRHRRGPSSRPWLDTSGEGHCEFIHLTQRVFPVNPEHQNHQTRAAVEGLERTHSRSEELQGKIVHQWICCFLRARRALVCVFVSRCKNTSGHLHHSS